MTPGAARRAAISGAHVAPALAMPRLVAVIAGTA